MWRSAIAAGVVGGCVAWAAPGDAQEIYGPVYQSADQIALSPVYVGQAAHDSARSSYYGSPVYATVAGECDCGPYAPISAQPQPYYAYQPATPVPANMYVGRGAFGQPTVYVPNQPIRNFMRWVTW